MRTSFLGPRPFCFPPPPHPPCWLLLPKKNNNSQRFIGIWVKSLICSSFHAQLKQQQPFLLTGHQWLRNYARMIVKMTHYHPNTKSVNKFNISNQHRIISVNCLYGSQSRLRVVSNFVDSGEIHARARKWAPTRLPTRGASPRGSPFSRARVYFAGIYKNRDYSQSKARGYTSTNVSPPLFTEYSCYGLSYHKDRETGFIPT